MSQKPSVFGQDEVFANDTGEIRTRERLGGLLKFYYREAA